MAELYPPRLARCALLAAGLLGFGPSVPAWADVVLKMMVVNPSETEVKEFDIRSPLPPEVKPEHVLDSDGLRVDYDSQSGTYVLVGKVTLKPKESVTKQVVLDDVWIIPADRFSSLRREMEEILRKLRGTAYQERGEMLGQAVERRLRQVEDSQDQPATGPMQHITQYRENLKTLDAVETDLVSLRQLMVMAALNPLTPSSPQAPPTGGASPVSGAKDAGGLSILTTWRLIFVILGLLGFVSLSFFAIWQRQLKLQLAKQAEAEASSATSSPAPVDAGSILDMPPNPPKPS